MEDSNKVVEVKVDTSRNLNLTTALYQVCTNMNNNATIILPVVNSYKDINLFFLASTDMLINLPAGVYWQNGEANTIIKSEVLYQYIFTFVPSINKWVGGSISFEVVA